MSMTDLSIRRPVTVLMTFLSLIVVGLIAARLLPLEYFPSIDFPGVFVQIPYRGSTPEEVEKQITRPAEEVLATISGLKLMSTTSDESGAQIFLRFDWGEETTLKALEVREKIDGIQKQWPSDVERYFTFQFSTNDMPVLMMRISSERDLSGAYELLNRKLKRRLERVDGVSKVELYGVYPREVRIELMADRVAAHNINLVELANELSQSDFSLTAGRITDGGKRFTLRPLGELKSLEQIQELVLNREGLRLDDIAQVSFEEPERTEGRHLSGTYAIGMNISKESGANTVEVARLVEREIEALKDDPEMTGINIFYMNNAADGIVSSLRDLLESGLIGALFSLIVLYLFLRRMSTTLIVTLAVPVSIIITLGALYFTGLSLNILSMMGLMLAVGMLVDNAVVVTESVHRHQTLDPDQPVEATRRGVKEVALAVTAGTITTGIVFLPFIVSPADEVTLFLKHVAISICIALGISLILSMTVVPLLMARLKPAPQDLEKKTYIDRIVLRYDRVLTWLVDHRWASVALMIGTLASVIIPMSFVNMDFFPDDEGTERRIELHYHINGAYTLDRVETAVEEVEAFLFAHRDSFEIESVYSYYTPGYAQSSLLLKGGEDALRSLEEIQNDIRAGMPKMAIANPSFSWQSGNDEEGIRVVLSGESSERLVEISNEVARVLGRVDGFTDVRSEATRGDEEIQVVVDRERARRYGFSTEQIATTVSTAMRGYNLRRYRTPDGEVEMRLAFQRDDQRSLQDLENLSVQGAGNETVRLAALANLKQRRGPQSIQRENRITMLGIQVNLDGINKDEGREKLEAVLANYQLPPGYQWGYSQRRSDEETSQQLMMVNLLLALVLIYIVMAALFESLIHPAAIWTSILYAIVGVFWFFFITNTTLQIMSWIGVLILIGVVVNNGIVLIDHINFLRGEGLERREAILKAGHDRFRPIVMTAATTVLGLIPLCVGTTQLGGDGPPYFPMARAIVGGLSFSTVVTLIILPTIYILLDDLRDWSRRVAYAAKK
ncbi:MAG: efflux RND transporter permease subunit [Rhodothermales bacterium]